MTSIVAVVVISPATSTRPVVVAVSHATRASGSWARIASRIESEIWSHILSGWPSVTLSLVMKRRADVANVVLISLPFLSVFYGQ